MSRANYSERVRWAIVGPSGYVAPPLFRTEALARESLNIYDFGRGYTVHRVRVTVDDAPGGENAQ